jgi:hypothetical protein
MVLKSVTSHSLLNTEHKFYVKSSLFICVFVTKELCAVHVRTSNALTPQYVPAYLALHMSLQFLGWQ